MTTVQHDLTERDCTIAALVRLELAAGRAREAVTNGSLAPSMQFEDFALCAAGVVLGDPTMIWQENIINAYEELGRWALEARKEHDAEGPVGQWAVRP